jgi:hypothetical protein
LLEGNKRTREKLPIKTHRTLFYTHERADKYRSDTKKVGMSGGYLSAIRKGLHFIFNKKQNLNHAARIQAVQRKKKDLETRCGDGSRLISKF